MSVVHSKMVKKRASDSQGLWFYFLVCSPLCLRAGWRPSGYMTDYETGTANCLLEREIEEDFFLPYIFFQLGCLHLKSILFLLEESL